MNQISKFFGLPPALLNVTARKVFKYGVFFCSAFSCIRSEYRKLRTRKTSVFGHFSHSLSLLAFINFFRIVLSKTSLMKWMLVNSHEPVEVNFSYLVHQSNENQPTYFSCKPVDLGFYRYWHRFGHQRFSHKTSNNFLEMIWKSTATWLFHFLKIRVTWNTEHEWLHFLQFFV